MNSNVAPHLALILFLPWYAVLAWLFWRLRATGHHARRKLAVFSTIVLSLLAAGFAGVWAYGYAEPLVGTIWKQVLASTLGYGAFLAGLLVGFVTLRSSAATLRLAKRQAALKISPMAKRHISKGQSQPHFTQTETSP